MYCGNCGTKVTEDSKYCGKCGAKILDNMSGDTSAISSHVSKWDEQKQWFGVNKI